MEKRKRKQKSKQKLEIKKTQREREREKMEKKKRESRSHAFRWSIHRKRFTIGVKFLFGHLRIFQSFMFIFRCSDFVLEIISLLEYYHIPWIKFYLHTTS